MKRKTALHVEVETGIHDETAFQRLASAEFEPPDLGNSASRTCSCKTAVDDAASPHKLVFQCGVIELIGESRRNV